jgi:yeast amino acid transporter
MSSDKYEGEPDVGASPHKDVESSRPAENVEYNLANTHDQLERGLKSRHIQFLALGELYQNNVRA